MVYRLRYNKDLELLIHDGIKRAEKRFQGNHSFPVLPDCENGIVILKHIQYHLNYGIGLQQIIDFIMYVKTVLNDSFWNKSFYEQAKKFNVIYLAKLIARIGQLYLGIDDSIQWCRNIDDADCDRLLHYIFSKGTMGRNINSESNVIVNTLNTKGESLLHLLKFEWQAGIRHSSLIREKIYLRPLAPVVGVFHHLKMARKSDISIIKIFKNSVESKRQLQLLKKIGANKGY